MNRHIVDQLADVRAHIKALGEREAVLKDEISKQMGGRDSLGGDEFIAKQSISERKGAFDEAAMRKAGIEPDAYRKPPVSVYSLRLEARVRDEAA